jgi:AhpD family alkylhydroperoxidase
MEQAVLERTLEQLYAPEKLRETAAALRRVLEARYGPLPYIFQVLEGDPEAFVTEGLRRFRQTGRGQISTREREAAAIGAAAALRCTYCLRAHLSRGGQAGFSDAELAEVLRVAAGISEAAVLAVGVRELHGPGEPGS